MALVIYGPATAGAVGSANRQVMATPAALGPSSTAYATLLSMAVEAGQAWSVRGVVIANGNQAADIKVQLIASGATGVTGWWGLTGAVAVSSTAPTATSVNPTNATAMASSGTIGITSGLLGLTVPQLFVVEGYLLTDTVAGTLDLKAGPLTSDAANAVTISYAELVATRVS